MRPKDELKKMDIEYLLHPVVTLRDHEIEGPRIIVEGEGAYRRENRYSGS